MKIRRKSPVRQRFFLYACIGTGPADYAAAADPEPGVSH